MILQWELLPEFNLIDTHSVSILRKLTPQSPYTTVTEDATWGCFEDPETDNPAVEYWLQIVYGSHTVMLAEGAFRKFPRPINSCRVDVSLTRVSGAPDSFRVITIDSGSDKYDRATYSTNKRGKAMFVLTHGSRVWLSIDGEKYMYDLVVPAVREITFEALCAYGTKLLAERRGNS